MGMRSKKGACGPTSTPHSIITFTPQPYPALRYYEDHSAHQKRLFKDRV